MIESVSPKMLAALARQMGQLTKSPPDGVVPHANPADISDIQADILGPQDTPYWGGSFRVRLVVEANFPVNPPKGFFLTKIFHPNVSEKGEICVNSLKKDWDPASWSLHHIFQVIRCLLIVPFPQSALNQEAGKLFMEDYEEYSRHARILTQVYAIKKDKALGSALAENKMEIEEDSSKDMKTQVGGKKQNDKKKWLKRI